MVRELLAEGRDFEIADAGRVARVQRAVRRRRARSDHAGGVGGGEADAAVDGRRARSQAALAETRVRWLVGLLPAVTVVCYTFRPPTPDGFQPQAPKFSLPTLPRQ